jgi:DDE superfamily endonuclease
LSYCPRSSLPAEALTWLAGRLADLLPPRPPGRGGNPPLALEIRLDAVAAVLLDGLSYRRAGRMVGISKTEVGESMDLLLPKLAALGFCQPDGTFITTLADLRQHLAEMAQTGEAVLVDGLATRVQRPRGWANQKVLYDAKRHAHTAQGLAISTIYGDLLWVDGGWPGSCHEHELIELAGLDNALDEVEVASLLDRGFRGLAKAREHWHAPVVTGAPKTSSPTGSGPTTASRLGCGRWWSRRSAIWPTPGRCAAGGGCCTGSGMSSGPLARWCALAGGSTGYRPEEHRGHRHWRDMAMRTSLSVSVMRSPLRSTVTLCRVPVNRNGAW